MEPALLRATGRSAGGRLFVALWGGLVVVDVSRPAGALVTGGLIVGLVACCGIGQSITAATAIAGTGWLVINGFVQHQYGQLGFSRGSWWLLASLLVVVVAVALRTEAGRR
jgi:hypothetical protein